VTAIAPATNLQFDGGAFVDVPPGVPTTLRPLGLGELLDRAVTLCVRNFWPLAAIYVGFAVLVEVLQFLGGADRAHMMGTLAEVLKRQSTGQSSADLLKSFGQYQPFGAWDAALLLSLLLLTPLPLAALTAASSAFVLGGTLGLGAAYRVAVQRWLQLILLNLTYAFAAGVAYGLFCIVVVLIGIALYAAALALKTIGIALAVIIGIAIFLVLIGAVVVAGLAYQVSLCTCVLEGASFWDAFLSGLRRVFVGVGLRRSLLVGLAYFAIFLGIGIVNAVGQGVLFGFVHSDLLGAIFSVIASVIAGAFSTVFLVLFYYDLRVREEGFDLQLSAGALPVAPSPAN
jgi:hypothetical protein